VGITFQYHYFKTNKPLDFESKS